MRRPVSWLAGLSPAHTFPVSQWHDLAGGLTAYSCGGSCGFGKVFPHRIPISSPVIDGRRTDAWAPYADGRGEASGVENSGKI